MEGEWRARSLHSRTPGCHAISSMPPTCQYVTLVCHAFCSMPRTQKHVASEGDLPSHVGGISQATLSGGFIFHGLIKLLSAGRQSEVPKFLGV